MPVLNFLLAVLLVTPTSVSGTVRAIGQDAAPFVIPGTTVSLTTPEGKVQVSTVTDDRGEFRFTDIQPGPYKLKAEMPGFQAFEKHITVSEGASTPYEILLTLAGLKETVVVTAEDTQLQASTASVSGVVSQQEMKTVPLFNEQFIDTLPLVPGVVRGPDGLI